MHYKARAECFADVISAFHIINEYNYDNEGYKIIRIISPTIKGSPMGDADFDFWTESPIRLLQKLWNDEGQDLHRIIQTIKPFEKYDGRINNTMWDEIKKYKEPCPKCYKEAIDGAIAPDGCGIDGMNVMCDCEE